MATVVGILLLGLGAVLVWAVDPSPGGIDVSTIGVILMALGGVGSFASVLVRGRATSARGETDGRAWDSLAPVGEARRQDDCRPAESRRRRLPWSS